MIEILFCYFWVNKHFPFESSNRNQSEKKLIKITEMNLQKNKINCVTKTILITLPYFEKIEGGKGKKKQWLMGLLQRRRKK